MVDLLSRYLGSACQTSFHLPGAGWASSRRSSESILPSVLVHSHLTGAFKTIRLPLHFGEIARCAHVCVMCRRHGVLPGECLRSWVLKQILIGE